MTGANELPPKLAMLAAARTINPTFTIADRRLADGGRLYEVSFVNRANRRVSLRRIFNTRHKSKFARREESVVVAYAATLCRKGAEP